MVEYITKEQVLEWFRPYGHTDEPIPFETLATDLRNCIPAADVVQVRCGKWTITDTSIENAVCSCCGKHFQSYYEAYSYCPNCGAKMDGGQDDG